MRPCDGRPITLSTTAVASSKGGVTALELQPHGGDGGLELRVCGAEDGCSRFFSSLDRFAGFSLAFSAVASAVSNP